MKVKVKHGIDYPLLDSLSPDAQRLYLFMLTQDGKKINLDAYCAILHLTMEKLCLAFIELLLKLGHK